MKRIDPSLKTRLTSAARQTQARYPDADPDLVVQAIIDAHHGMTTFGYRDDELTAAAIADIAVRDPRLRARRAQRRGAAPATPTEPVE